MGVLDDAIREHLELKRKHGAAEEELRRQEEEALGPVRREVPPSTDEGSLSDGEQSIDAAEAHEETEHAVEESTAGATGATSAPFDGDALPQEPAPDVSDPEPFPEEAAPVVQRPNESAEPLPDPEAPDTVREPTSDRLDAHEDRAPDYPPALDDAADGDVEEARSEGPGDTPDFVEETPEHDRLWFEQKPPRDFDFD
jgi:hypothetical protein